MLPAAWGLQSKTHGVSVAAAYAQMQEDLSFPDQTKVICSTLMLFFVWGHVLVTSLVVGPKYPTQLGKERLMWAQFEDTVCRSGEGLMAAV